MISSVTQSLHTTTIRGCFRSSKKHFTILLSSHLHYYPTGLDDEPHILDEALTLLSERGQSDYSLVSFCLQALPPPLLNTLSLPPVSPSPICASTMVSNGHTHILVQSLST